MRRGQRRGELAEPIARWEPDGDGEILLMDTKALMIHLEVGDRTVRRYEPVACDVATRAPLYDALAAGRARLGVRSRTPRDTRAAARAGGLRMAT